MDRNTHHDLLARIVALLLGLALLAERTASRHRATRCGVLHILLPAKDAALELLDMPADEDDPAIPRPSDDRETLLHCAVIFRALAALFMHAGLAEGVAASPGPRLVVVAPPRHLAPKTPCRFLGWVGLAFDTS